MWFHCFFFIIHIIFPLFCTKPLNAIQYKKIRQEKNLSLDQSTEITNISKNMLSQIERGETNPTISTLWKITTGLKVSLTELIETALPSKSLITKEEIVPLV